MAGRLSPQRVIEIQHGMVKKIIQGVTLGVGYEWPANRLSSSAANLFLSASISALMTDAAVDGFAGSVTLLFAICWFMIPFLLMKI